MIILVFALTALVLSWLVAAFCYRFANVRKGGTPVLLRMLPAVGDAGWRHGVVLYGDLELRYFRLSSVRILADAHFSRHHIEIVGRRKPQAGELEIMPERVSVVDVACRGVKFEIALDRDSLTALQSWIESRPPERTVRRVRR
ncbi:DUF2550 domain-containing protein [Tomitella biformata]|uniref:DUF2550 domain-containing protein n=1 Tax=Tomitella biformata TaxID=630403 RepID=UPI0004BC4256|nr:DUF2550 domain-containing protein [Tomitella biformata]